LLSRFFTIGVTLPASFALVIFRYVFMFCPGWPQTTILLTILSV
jgi:hypothetical protein